MFTSKPLLKNFQWACVCDILSVRNSFLMSLLSRQAHRYQQNPNNVSVFFIVKGRRRTGVSIIRSTESQAYSISCLGTPDFFNFEQKWSNGNGIIQEVNFVAEWANDNACPVYPEICMIFLLLGILGRSACFFSSRAWRCCPWSWSFCTSSLLVQSLPPVTNAVQLLYNCKQQIEIFRVTSSLFQLFFFLNKREVGEEEIHKPQDNRLPISWKPEICSWNTEIHLKSPEVFPAAHCILLHPSLLSELHWLWFRLYPHLQLILEVLTKQNLSSQFSEKLLLYDIKQCS